MENSIVLCGFKECLEKDKEIERLKEIIKELEEANDFYENIVRESIKELKLEKESNHLLKDIIINDLKI